MANFYRPDQTGEIAVALRSCYVCVYIYTLRVDDRFHVSFSRRSFVATFNVSLFCASLRGFFQPSNSRKCIGLDDSRVTRLDNVPIFSVVRRSASLLVYELFYSLVSFFFCNDKWWDRSTGKLSWSQCVFALDISCGIVFLMSIGSASQKNFESELFYLLPEWVLVLSYRQLCVRREIL